jgi:hypothetical protein
MNDEQNFRSGLGVSMLTLAIWCHHGVVGTLAGAAPPASNRPARPLPLDRWTDGWIKNLPLRPSAESRRAAENVRCAEAYPTV